MGLRLALNCSDLERAKLEETDEGHLLRLTNDDGQEFVFTVTNPQAMADLNTVGTDADWYLKART